jgi:hypothetical protein
MHTDADGTWHADLDPAQDVPTVPDAVTPPTQARIPASADPAAPGFSHGVNLDCATATLTTASGAPTYNACDWYNADAAGLFVDDKSAGLTATQRLATAVLTAMTR